jgi:hypothetical protein
VKRDVHRDEPDQQVRDREAKPVEHGGDDLPDEDRRIGQPTRQQRFERVPFAFTSD